MVFSEASEQLAPSSSADDIRAATQAARLAGFDIYTIPPDFSFCENATNALWHVPIQAHETLALWIGYIPTVERYEAIYDAALSKNIRLINSPRQHKVAQEFDAAYDLLGELTPRSFILTSLDECEAAVEHVGLPVFVKGVCNRAKRAAGKRASPKQLTNCANYRLICSIWKRAREVVSSSANW